MTSSSQINIEALKSMYGEESIRELVDLSMDEAGKLVDSLGRNIPLKDTDEVTRDAHQLKGMASTMTLSQIFEFSRELERHAKDGQWVETDNMLAEIKRCLVELQDYLRDTPI
ncbi:MAG: Hpt domain-containing protein [Candidatus Obscuribacterales bacterium]|nr:Hpt domain-containing protein [Candidatus Obscuribacterales bacterium]